MPAACVTVTVWPATVSVPVRLLEVEFAAATKTTDPIPVPLAPEEIVIQAAWLADVHPHCVPLTTLMVFELCVGGTETDVGYTL